LGKYPVAEQSSLLKYGGILQDVGREIAPGLRILEGKPMLFGLISIQDGKNMI